MSAECRDEKDEDSMASRMSHEWNRMQKCAQPSLNKVIGEHASEQFVCM